MRRSITDTFHEQVYVTPSGMFTRSHFDFIYTLLGAERILFSLDYPYQSLDGAHEFIDSLPVALSEKEMIAYKNAEKLLGL